MPGLITHSKLFTESVLYLSKKKNIRPFTRSIEILFHNERFFNCGLFGIIGPDLFDYLPFQKRGFLGTELTEFLHSRGLATTLERLLLKVFSVSDHNNEWNASRRAFLYGYISHIIADSIFHPFVFYWSGFPDTSTRKEVYSQREQFLLFLYNMDIYFEFFHGGEVFNFSINSLLPLNKMHGPLMKLDNSLKSLLIETLHESYPAVKNDKWFRKTDPGAEKSVTMLDLLPYIINYSYRLKRNKNRFSSKILEKIQHYQLCPPDYITRYPNPRRINRHVLNLHRERWYYPAGKSGLNYESVEDLFRIARDRIIEMWEKMESLLFTKDKNITSVLKDLNVDCYTGETAKYAHNMSIKNPIRLRF